MNLSHVAGNEHLKPIGFCNQSTELFLIGGGDFRFDMARLAKRIPITSIERVLDAGKQVGDGFEPDDLLPRLSGDVRPGLAKVGEALCDKRQGSWVLAHVGLCQLVKTELVDGVE